MGSTRLPGKIMKQVLGKELLLHQVDRIKRAESIDQVVVITSTHERDQAIETLCRAHQLNVYRGSESDLLDRHYQAAKMFGADFVVKIPSDCPLTDPAVIDEVIDLWRAHPDLYDYVSNYHPPTFPDGLDVEGCPLSVLETAWREAKKPYEREHTFPFIWDQPERFRIGNVENPRGNMFMTHRWTLDYEADFLFMKAVYEAFKDRPFFQTDDILALLNEKPEIALLNQSFAGVNWYRHVPGQLKTVSSSEYRQEKE